MENLTFKCGCKFELKDHSPAGNNSTPSIDIDISKIDYSCSKTWDIICEGKTKGVFQLESNLGQSWAKRVKPKSIEELAALSALLRPGCLKAIVDGKSMTQHYVDRKHGEEEISYLHDSLEPILKSTQGVLVYQEQSMKIAEVIAGFNLQEADNLRKAIGKKKADLMADIKKKFLKGAKKKGVVSKEIAEEIFSWIEKSNRYAFNKSHAVSYAVCGYWSAYVKAHFPLNFYCNYLYYARGKPDSQEEIRELISDAKLNDITVTTPSLKYMSESFEIRDGLITFGFKDIKYIGESQAKKLFNSIKEQETRFRKKMSDWTWYEFLVHVSGLNTTKVISSLILVGALSFFPDHESRSRTLYEFETWQKLTAKEKDWIKEQYTYWDNLFDALLALKPTKKDGGGTANKNRREIVKDLIYQLKNPPYELKDFPNDIANEEDRLLGVSITYSKIDSCDTSMSNGTCKEFIDGKPGKMSLAVEVKSCREWAIKNGKMKNKKMAFITVEDNSCELSSVIAFPETWEENKELLVKGNTVLIIGERSKKKDSFIVQRVSQI